MKKDKTRHFETFYGKSYPKKLPAMGKLGKHDVNNGVFGQDPEVIATHSHNGVVTHERGRIQAQDLSVKEAKQPSRDEIWEWLGDPDRE